MNFLMMPRTLDSDVSVTHVGIDSTPDPSDGGDIGTDPVGSIRSSGVMIKASFDGKRVLICLSLLLLTRLVSRRKQKTVILDSQDEYEDEDE